MGDYRTVFRKRHTFLTVIHAESKDQVLKNVAISKDCGADGTFLINHSISPEALFRLYNEAHRFLPDYWIGLNVLGMTPLEVLKRLPPVLLRSLKGFWTDNPCLDSGLAQEFNLYRHHNAAWDGLYFGSAAFKHQPDFTNDPQEAALAALRALPYVDVVTTSGAATGFAPPVSKIRAMKRDMDDEPLAVASGLTLENLGNYLPFADCFLVATGVSNSFTDLSPQKVLAFHDQCENYCPRPR